MGILNSTSLVLYRNYAENNKSLNQSLKKLSSGRRINAASDDAAGLAISTKLQAQTAGLYQASRNVEDACSMLQTADGGLGEIHSLLQRGRQLAVQAANDTLTLDDKKKIATELTQIIKEIDNIATYTEFNTIKVLQYGSSDDKSIPPASPPSTLTPLEQQIITGLKTSWLQQSEALVAADYGLTASGAELYVKFVDSSSYAAEVFNMYPFPTVYLTINLSYFNDPTLPNGGSGPVYYDRIIAHEMTHAIMSQNMDISSLPTWFVEGTAEFTHGGDERILGDIINNGGGTSPSQVASGINGIVSLINTPWSSDSPHYSAGYAAVRFLHNRIKAAGGSGIQELLTFLKNNPSASFSDALKNITHGSYTNGLSDFITDFSNNGAAYIQNLAGPNIMTGSLNNADTGAIGGNDADGGPVKTPQSVVPDTANLTDDPLVGFTEFWPDDGSPSTPDPVPDPASPGSNATLQVGPQAKDTISVNLPNITSSTLDIADVDVVTQAGEAISKFDKAIDSISSERVRLGSFQNRLEHISSITQNTAAATTAADSRIQDLDMASEMCNFLKKTIIQQVSASMMAYSNLESQTVLHLLTAS